MPISNLKKIIKRKIGRNLNFVGRKLTVFDDDTFIVSYPKSGNTWTRFLVASLLNPEQEISFSNIDEKIPDIYQTSDRYLLNLPRPRLIKSHEYFDPRYKKVICIVRDPRDVLVSNYYHYLKYTFQENVESLEEFGEKFVCGDYEIFPNKNRFGSWKDNVGSWLGAKEGNSDFLLIRYEDLKEDCEYHLGKIAKFLGADDSLENIQRAIEKSSIKRMRTLEKQETNVWPARQSQRKDILFVRSAKSGKWQEELPISIVEKISKNWATAMKRLGYTP